MFTGLVERTAEVVAPGRTLRVRAPGLVSEPGWSVSVDGSCLTVAGLDRGDLLFELSPETLSRTIAREYRRGSIVNIELPLRADARLHGHIVTGHVDGTGRIVSFVRRGGCAEATVSFPPSMRRLIVEKGSVAVSGISLTVASVSGDRFTSVLVPATLASSSAGGWTPGAAVNIETDIIGKYLLGRDLQGERDALLGEYLGRHENGSG